MFACESDQASTNEGEATTEVAENEAAPELNTDEANEEEIAEAGAELPPADAVGPFGAPIEAEGAVGADDLLTQLADSDSIQVKYRGNISAVCQAKGCWMTMPLAEEKEMTVKFKDYGFFVPINSTDKEAVVEGWAYREIVSVEELKHLAEDNKASEEEIDAITEPEERITFMADGVIIEASAAGAE